MKLHQVMCKWEDNGKRIIHVKETPCWCDKCLIPDYDNCYTKDLSVWIKINLNTAKTTLHPRILELCRFYQMGATDYSAENNLVPILVGISTTNFLLDFGNNDAEIVFAVLLRVPYQSLIQSEMAQPSGVVDNSEIPYSFTIEKFDMVVDFKILKQLISAAGQYNYIDYPNQAYSTVTIPISFLFAPASSSVEMTNITYYSPRHFIKYSMEQSYRVGLRWCSISHYRINTRCVDNIRGLK